MTEKTDRILFWDILKGIGIISIVFGHSQNLGIAIRAVYFYHLAIFFFISGYFYQEDRYGDDPFGFFARRLKHMWTPYICYGIFFVLIHNVLSSQILFPLGFYDKKEQLHAIINTLLLICEEGPAGAMWFVPVLLATGAGFSFIIWFCRAYIPKNLYIWAVIILSMAAGGFGLILNWKGIFLKYHIQTALLVIPVYCLGYLLRRKACSVQTKARWYGAVLSLGIILVFLLFTKESVELSAGKVPSGINFYILSAAGIYLCCFAAKWLNHLKRTGKIVALLGKYSFDIMALHFLVFKVIDRVYALMIMEPAENQGAFPHAYPEFHIIYFIMGLLVPLLIAMGSRKIIHKAGSGLRNWAEGQGK